MPAAKCEGFGVHLCDVFLFASRVCVGLDAYVRVLSNRDGCPMYVQAVVRACVCVCVCPRVCMYVVSARELCVIYVSGLILMRVHCVCTYRAVIFVSLFPTKIRVHLENCHVMTYMHTCMHRHHALRPKGRIPSHTQRNAAQYGHRRCGGQPRKYVFKGPESLFPRENAAVPVWHKWKQTLFFF